MKVDLETLKAMKDLMTHPHMGEIVPVGTQDKDSFAMFRGGLKDNWIFIGAVFSIAWFVFNSINDGKAVDQTQNTQIQANVKAIESNAKDIQLLNNNVQTLNTNHLNSNNELIRKIDALQTAVDSLKSKQ